MMRRAPASAPALLAGDARGVVVLEFLIAVGPLFLLFLATVQFGLIAVASLVVHHAAAVGVRAAVVVLDDDPRFYAGAARGSLVGKGDADRAPRMAAIRRAVNARIVALTPDPGVLGALGARTGALSVGAALGTQPLARLVFGLSRYADITTAVTFPTAPGASTLSILSVDQSARITLRVTHMFVCLVPIVSALMCRSLAWDAESGRLAEPARGQAAARQHTRELRMAALAADQRELARAGLRVCLLSGEATLPAQAAAYRYVSERAEQAAP